MQVLVVGSRRDSGGSGCGGNHLLRQILSTTRRDWWNESLGAHQWIGGCWRRLFPRECGEHRTADTLNQGNHWGRCADSHEGVGCSWMLVILSSGDHTASAITADEAVAVMGRERHAPRSARYGSLVVIELLTQPTDPGDMQLVDRPVR